MFTEDYDSSIPAILVTVVSVVFIFAIFLFLFYDRLVERRQSLVLQKAIQSTAIVSSLFPKNVRDRLMNTAGPTDGTTKGTRADSKPFRSIMDGPMEGSKHDTGGDAIADLFSNCTVMFADIAGFTAWSSTRSPEQVFCLLQAIYQAFDKVALRRCVFKVETIGDSYVAVSTGLSPLYCCCVLNLFHHQTPPHLILCNLFRSIPIFRLVF
jgi:Adenylate and Guanylate cyclase catalytic domain